MSDITIDRRLPADYVEQELGMSNFAHVVDDGFEEALRRGAVYGRHAGWHFNGLVWFEDGRFHEEVWCYQAYCETLSAATLEDLMAAVSDKYGYD